MYIYSSQQSVQMWKKKTMHCQSIEFRVEDGGHGQKCAIEKWKYNLHSMCVRLHLDTNSFFCVCVCVLPKWFVDPFFPMLMYGCDRRYSKIKWNQMKLGEKNFTKLLWEYGGLGRLKGTWCTFSMESLEMRTIEFIVHAIVYTPLDPYPVVMITDTHSLLLCCCFFLVSCILSSFSFIFISFS